MPVWTVVSAPAVRVTGAQLPLKVSQVPFESGGGVALDHLCCQVEAGAGVGAAVDGQRDGGRAVPGAAARSTLWPVGAVVSGVRVKVEAAVRPLLLVAVTVLSPVAVLVSSQV